MLKDRYKNAYIFNNKLHPTSCLIKEDEEEPEDEKTIIFEGSEEEWKQIMTEHQKQ